MARGHSSHKFSGAAKVWQEFATDFCAIGDEATLVDEEGISSDELRDEYLRLPYAEVLASPECRW